MNSSLLPIELGRHLSEIEGCEFVGVSDTGEVFVSWHNIDPAAKEDAINLISEWPEVTQVTEVYSVSRKEVQELVEGLNDLLKQTEEDSDVHSLSGSNPSVGGGEREAIRAFLEGYDNDTGCSGSSCSCRDKQESSHVCQEGCRKSPSGDSCGGCGC